MLIGGFYSVDGSLLCRRDEGKDFDLRSDFDGIYRKVYTNNGRTASVAALAHCREHMQGKKVLLPDYLCLSVISAMEAAGAEYDFYQVKGNLEIDMESLLAKINDDVGMIYIIHYFGVPQPAEIVKKLRQTAQAGSILLMEDITQALFSRDRQSMGFGDYIVASLRKWLPMTDGGLLAVRENLTAGRQLPCLKDAYDESVYRELLISVLRLQYEICPEADKEVYLQYEREANASRYKNLTPRKMTEASMGILRHGDMDALMDRRIENYNYLYERLEKIRWLKLLSRPFFGQREYVPFGLTLLAEDRDGLYRYLTEHNIIPEIQWILPSEYYEPGKEARFMSAHNLMIQCDQRYGLKEMKYVADVLEAYG